MKSTKMVRIRDGLIFAILWTAAMWWWEAPLDTPAIMILMITGALAGLGWSLAFHWLMDRWLLHHRNGPGT